MDLADTKSDSATRCPPDAAFLRHFAGEMDLVASERLARHVNACPECSRRQLELLAGNDPLHVELRGMSIPTADARIRPQAEPAETSVRLEVTRTRADSKESSVTNAPASHLPKGYELIGELSRGGQGVVYEALQKSTKRNVAIKVLLEGSLASVSTRRRFEREIELIAQLQHPNIIAIFDSGTMPDGQPFYVMDFVRGLPMHRYIRENHLPIDAALRLFATVCDAVQHAHQHGIIHRDLKPSNILVDAEGNPHILDFGLAKSLSADETELTTGEGFLGTLPYMSPEQASGHSERIDIRTDVYALGVILYELLTGHFPYPITRNIAEVLRHIHATEPTPPTRQWTVQSGIASIARKGMRGASKCPIDDDIQTIVLKALHKDPNRRYQSVGDLGADARRYLNGEAILAKKDSSWYTLRKMARRHKATAMALTTVVLAGATIPVYMGWAYFEVKSQRDQRGAALKLAEASARESEHVASMAVEQSLEQTRKGAMGWFLNEWHAGRMNSARRICNQLRASPEKSAMQFLLDPQITEDQFRREHASRDPMLVNYCIAERREKGGNHQGADRAFREAISTDGNDWLRELAQERLTEIQALLTRKKTEPAQEVRP